MVAAFRAGVARNLAGKGFLVGDERENKGMKPVLIIPHYRLCGFAVLRERVSLVYLGDVLADVGEFEVAGVRKKHTRLLRRFNVAKQIFYESVVDETLEAGSAVAVAAHGKKRGCITTCVDQFIEVVQKCCGGQGFG
ncbi:hypothetical protein C5O24_11660 [Paramuribaculum intestinale]|nr:hypothetical protein C5O24_11660 [Paramuribaculum intestinale]